MSRKKVDGMGYVYLAALHTISESRTQGSQPDGTLEQASLPLPPGKPLHIIPADAFWNETAAHFFHR